MMTANTPNDPMADLAAWPPALTTAEPGSFAHNTLKVRVHGILAETVAANDFPAEIRAALAALSAEIRHGVIRPLREAAPDAAFWAAAVAPYAGRSWLDVPWYWAEAYFYRRILEATGYFHGISAPASGTIPEKPSTRNRGFSRLDAQREKPAEASIPETPTSVSEADQWRGVDPFARIKRREWAADAAPAALARLLAVLPEDTEGRFGRLLHASLWGNRTDLSYTVAAHLGATAAAHSESENLLADDSAAIWRHLLERSDGRVAVIADNAGTELLMDLALIDFLLCAGLAAEVHLHLKPHPFYVSDAMPQDVADGLDALIAAGGPGQHLAYRLTGHITSGDLRLKTHWFYTSSLFYTHMPADLIADLAEMDLVVVKGDANYRRLLGDAAWPPTTPFEAIVSYFPAPLAALRTLKAELIVGLRPGQAERLRAEDPAWLVNGRRGVIQARLPD